jgi:superfamily II DNA or RNA helicase
MLSDLLKPQDIAGLFSPAAFEKARVLQRNGRVRGLEVDEEFGQINALVQGSEPAPYAVDIDLRKGQGGKVVVEGTCSCPMAFNCKHVAATLLEAVTAPRLALGGGSGSAKAPVAPVLSPEIQAWLETIGKASRGDDYPAEVRQRLLYCVQSHAASNQVSHLAVTLLSVRLRKDDSFSEQAARVNNAFVTADRAPAFYRDCDIEILGGLAAHHVIFGSGVAFLVRSAALMERIVQTGRAYWRNQNGAPLRWGDARVGHIAWQPVGPRGVGARLIVDNALALNSEPPVYVDEAPGVIGPLEAGVPARVAQQLLSAPILAASQLGEVSRRLSQRLPSLGAALLPGPPAETIKVAAEPKPVLRLLRALLSSYYYDDDDPDSASVALVRLGFRYGPIEIDASETQMTVEAFHDGRIHQVKRDRAREKRASKRLSDLKLLPSRGFFPYIASEYLSDLTLQNPYDWWDFVHRHVEDLRREGFEIRIDRDFPYQLATSSGIVDAEIESSGIDWFELGFSIEIDGKKHDLAELLVTLLSDGEFSMDDVEQLAANNQPMYVPLPDGRHFALAADRFLPVITALHGLKLNGLSPGKSGKIKLSRAEIVPLFGVETESFAFKGLDSLRRLADLVRDRQQNELVLPPGFTATLRPYQQQGVAWLDLLRESGLGGVLADDMGLGKTVQVLALLALEKARGALTAPVLIVAPTSLMTNWFNEARKFVPDLKVLVFHGASRKQSTEQIAEHDVVLTTYPLIARDHELLLARDWHMAILDEAQTIKNPNAATTRWLSGIKASHRFCLTGTPMENHLGELWSIMSFANPGYLGDKTAFSRNWRTPIEKNADAERLAALIRRVKPFLLRRTKEVVAAELPAKIEIVETVAIEGKQRDLYDSIRVSMSEKVRKALKERGLARSHIVVLEALLRLRQVCCDPALLKLDGAERPSAKLDRLMEMVDELLSEGRKIIIFSQFTSMLDLIETRFTAAQVRYELLTGETRDRKSPIEAFQNGKSDVFLISLKAGGVGLNLTAADTVIIFDPWWNPAVEEQAIDRAHRIGQDKKVFVYRLVAAGTIEEKIGELKARKQALADSLFEHDGKISAALTEADITALLS